MKQEEKEKKEKKETRKRLKLKFKILIIIVLVILYAIFIGTKGIFIKDFVVSSNKIDDNLNGVKIAQFSDLHYGSGISKKEVKSLVNKINITKPDIVIFNGDLIDEKYNIKSSEIIFLKKELAKIDAEYGKYYVTGEEDFENEINILNASGFTNLANGEQVIYFGKTPLLLIDNNNSKNYFENNEVVPNYKVLIIHNPSDFDKFKKYNFELALAGHTHNGQINIPKLRKLFINSKYDKNYQKIDNTNLFVNPGIGNSKIKARLFNHPTIYLYRLKNTPSN